MSDETPAPSDAPLSRKDAIALLRELLARRREGGFVSDEEGRARTRAMIARKRAERGL